MKRKPRAARVVPYRVSGPCNCAVCSEREQLSMAAKWHPQTEVRVSAVLFLGLLDAVAAGHCGGGVELRNIFD